MAGKKVRLKSGPENLGRQYLEVSVNSARFDAVLTVAKYLKSTPSRPASNSSHGPRLATKLYRCEAIAGAQLAQYAVNVVFHSLFREIQPGCNLLVSKAVADQLNELLFPASEAEILLEDKMHGMRGLFGDVAE